MRSILSFEWKHYFNSSSREKDIDALYSFDLIVKRENERRESIRRAVTSGECFVAVADEKVIGYGVLNYTFHYVGCIDLLYVHSDYRRGGAGVALLQHLESLCQTPKLFTSTNLSNLPMQSLLAKLSYVLSGLIHNLDEDDPKIVYFKRLRWPEWRAKDNDTPNNSYAAIKILIKEMNKPALLIIDMLNDSFVSERLFAKRVKLCDSINKLLHFARENEFHIIWIRQEFKADLSDAFLEMRDENINMYIEGTFGSKILEELRQMDGELEIIKKR